LNDGGRIFKILEAANPIDAKVYHEGRAAIEAANESEEIPGAEQSVKGTKNGKAGEVAGTTIRSRVKDDS
jgi:hypothetical protein